MKVPSYRQFVLVSLLLLSFCEFCIAESGEKIQPDNLFPRVSLLTDYGSIIVELDRTRAPITTNNFLAYVVAGKYDGTLFHRIIADFVVQTGGYDVFYQERDTFKPIYNESGNGLKNQMYTIAMARDKNPHSATSQFYFNMADNPGLDPGKDWGYAVFGLVMEGTDVLDLLAKAQTRLHPKLGWEDVPVKELVLKKVTLLAE